MTSLHERLLTNFPLLRIVSGDAFAVGGAVRDLVLGVTPFEVDLCAFGAKQIAAEFAHAVGGRLVDMGRERFTTWRVVAGDHEYDFSEIEGSFESDIRRRDCTMNAVAVSLATGEVLDLVDGVPDAERRLIRMIAERNFEDDPLRILKLVRLAVTRDCSIDPPTLAAMKTHASRVSEVAVERVSAELRKILEHSRAHDGVQLVRELGLDGYLFGRDSDEATAERLKALLEGDFVTRLAALTWELSDAERRELTERFRWSDATARELHALVSLTRLLGSAGDDVLLALHEAGESTAERAVLLLGATGAHERSLQIARIMREHDALFSTKPLLDGREIGNLLGITAGRRIGELKRALLAAQLRGDVATRDEAARFLDTAKEKGE